MTGHEVTIQNVVATVDLKIKLKLERLVERFPPEVNIRYIPEQFPGLVLKLKEPVKISSLIFRTGKCVVTGAKDRKMIDKGVEEIKKLLGSIGYQIRAEPSIVIQNIVASGSLGQKIDLELASLLLDNSMYEPEQFPGLIYRMKEPKTVLLLFQSGNLVCTGAKTVDDVHTAVGNVFEVLLEVEALSPEVPLEE